jgi:hypothetical protein
MPNPKVRRLLSLPPNWDSYGSQPPTPEAGATAERLLENLGLDPFVCPISGGGIQIEITIGPDGTVSADDSWENE